MTSQNIILCFYKTLSSLNSQGREGENPTDTEVREVEIIPLLLHGFDLSWMKGNCFVLVLVNGSGHENVVGMLMQDLLLKM